MKTKNILFYLILSAFILSCENRKPKIEKITPEKYKTIIAETKSKKMVHFWASYCEPCVEEFPELLEYCNKEKILLINISSDKSESKMQDNMEKIMTKMNIKHSFIIDYDNIYPQKPKNINLLEDFCKKAGIKNSSNPYYILMDENGNILKEYDELKKIEK